jgi:hypothetical protein
LVPHVNKAGATTLATPGPPGHQETLMTTANAKRSLAGAAVDQQHTITLNGEQPKQAA